MMTQGYAALFFLTHWFNARPCPTPRETAPRRERELLKSLALIEEPLLEGRAADALALEKLTPIKIGSALKVFSGSRSDERLEGHGIDLDSLGPEHNRLTVSDERTVAQGLAKCREGLAQAAARLFVSSVAPQERCEPFARLRFTGAPYGKASHKAMSLTRIVSSG